MITSVYLYESPLIQSIFVVVVVDKKKIRNVANITLSMMSLLLSVCHSTPNH
jgi:hypothetical protein